LLLMKVLLWGSPPQFALQKKHLGETVS
jgi:hypothetical protein